MKKLTTTKREDPGGGKCLICFYQHALNVKHQDMTARQQGTSHNDIGH